MAMKGGGEHIVNIACFSYYCFSFFYRPEDMFRSNLFLFNARVVVVMVVVVCVCVQLQLPYPPIGYANARIHEGY